MEYIPRSRHFGDCSSVHRALYCLSSYLSVLLGSHRVGTVQEYQRANSSAAPEKRVEVQREDPDNQLWKHPLHDFLSSHVDGRVHTRKIPVQNGLHTVPSVLGRSACAVISV